MKNEHTPGPWEVHTSSLNKGSKYTILHPLVNGPDAAPQYRGKLGGYHVVMGERNCQEGYLLTEADARLMAAAPELLEACERGLACAISLDDEQSQKDAEVIRSAIKKAMGKK